MQTEQPIEQAAYAFVTPKDELDTLKFSLWIIFHLILMVPVIVVTIGGMLIYGEPPGWVFSLATFALTYILSPLWQRSMMNHYGELKLIGVFIDTEARTVRLSCLRGPAYDVVVPFDDLSFRVVRHPTRYRRPIEKIVFMRHRFEDVAFVRFGMTQNDLEKLVVALRACCREIRPE